MSKSGRGFFAYFASPNGKKIVLAGACCTSISLFVGNFFPQTFFLNKYQEVITCYQDGVERKVPEKLRQRLNKAFDVLDVPAHERRIIKPFTVYGFDMYQAGSTKYKFGGIIGLPVNYSCDSVEEFNKRDVRFRNKPIDWNSAGGQILQESLILTEEEQIFGMCRSILQLQTQKVLLNSIFPTFSFLCVYAMGNYCNTSLNLLARPFSLRMVMYTLLGLFGLGTWSFLKDFNQVRYDTAIDTTLCELGPNFVKAGVGFYDKMLKKNIALRNLIGDETYTAKGNENYFLRQKSLPITLRKSYFETKLEELRKKVEQNVEANI